MEVNAHGAFRHKERVLGGADSRVSVQDPESDYAVDKLTNFAGSDGAVVLAARPIARLVDCWDRAAAAVVIHILREEKAPM